MQGCVAVCWGIREHLEHAGGWRGAQFLVWSRLDEKMMNKLLKVSMMKTPDFRNIDGVICLAAPEPTGGCRYLGNNWAGNIETDSARAGAPELGSLSQLPFSPELKGLSACPSLSAPARGVAVGTFLAYLNPWHCNCSCRLKLGIRKCHSNVPM